MVLPSSENVCISREENLCKLLSSKGKCLDDSQKAFGKFVDSFTFK